MDAFHLAWAEYLKADVLVTTDSQFLSKCRLLGDKIKVRVINPLSMVQELGK
jgi:predicted nucleic acid-binding protein